MARFWIQTEHGIGRDEWRDSLGFVSLSDAEQHFRLTEQARLDGIGAQVKHRLIERREEVLLHPFT